MLSDSAGKQISEEEGDVPLIPSSTMLRLLLMLCGRRQTVTSDIKTQSFPHTIIILGYTVNIGSLGRVELVSLSKNGTADGKKVSVGPMKIDRMRFD